MQCSGGILLFPVCEQKLRDYTLSVKKKNSSQSVLLCAHGEQKANSNEILKVANNINSVLLST